MAKLIIKLFNCIARGLHFLLFTVVTFNTEAEYNDIMKNYADWGADYNPQDPIRHNKLNKCQIQYSVYLFASDFWCIPVIIFLNQ